MFGTHLEGSQAYSTLQNLSPPVFCSVEAERFDKGGTSEIFRGDYEGRPVAVKVPIFRCLYVQSSSNFEFLSIRMRARTSKREISCM